MKVYIYCSKSRNYVYYKDIRNPREDFKLISKALADEFLNGKVVASFELDKVAKFNVDRYLNIIPGNINIEEIKAGSCMTNYDLFMYKNGRDCLYGWHIDNLQMLDKPKDITSFCTRPVVYKDGIPSKKMIMKAPQSWCYAEDLAGNPCIIISIKSKWLWQILNGEKTYEIRKTAPKELVK